VRPPAAGKPGARVASYGVTREDLAQFARVQGVVEVVPVRTFPAEARRLEKTFHSGRVLATTAAFAEVNGLRTVAGRFLDAGDETGPANAVVLGTEVAEALLPPGADPVGQTVTLGGNSYVVVGVLAGQQGGAAGLTEDALNNSVFMPLATCQVRFGERVYFREAGMRRGEAVQVYAAQVVLARGADAAAVAGALRSILQDRHEQKDWEVLQRR
jgi:putative ABC transport system permease protein